LRVVSYGCGTWSVKFSEENRLRLFENGMLRKIFGPKREEVTWDWRNYIIRSLMIFTPVIGGDHIKNEMGGECSTY